jgi:hypothetical protein
VSTSREKFERWLKHAEQLEEEMKHSPPPPAVLGSAYPPVFKNHASFRKTWGWLFSKNNRPGSG